MVFICRLWGHCIFPHKVSVDSRVPVLLLVGHGLWFCGLGIRGSFFCFEPWWFWRINVKRVVCAYSMFRYFCINWISTVLFCWQRYSRSLKKAKLCVMDSRICTLHLGSPCVDFGTFMKEACLLHSIYENWFDIRINNVLHSVFAPQNSKAPSIIRTLLTYPDVFRWSHK